MARDYGRKIGFTGDFYLEPKPKEPTKHQYDFDVATCMNFLRKYDLTADFKMNIEANHATLASIPSSMSCVPPSSTAALAPSTPTRATICWDGIPTSSPPTCTAPPTA